MKMLTDYEWPGNLRELHHTMRSITLFCEGAAQPRSRATRDRTERVLALILLRMLLVGSTKVRVPKEELRKDEKPIRLNDLFPSREVTGGRRTVFGGSRVAAPQTKAAEISPNGIGGMRDDESQNRNVEC